MTFVPGHVMAFLSGSVPFLVTPHTYPRHIVQRDMAEFKELDCACAGLVGEDNPNIDPESIDVLVGGMLSS